MPMLWIPDQAKNGRLADARHLWCKIRLTQDFKEWGSGIPAYFGLLRFYNVIAFTVLLINAIYPVFVTYLVCNHFNKDDICV